MGGGVPDEGPAAGVDRRVRVGDIVKNLVVGRRAGKGDQGWRRAEGFESEGKKSTPSSPPSALLVGRPRASSHLLYDALPSELVEHRRSEWSRRLVARLVGRAFACASLMRPENACRGRAVGDGASLRPGGSSGKLDDRENPG